jgi:predicted Zn-dependent protease
LLRKLSPSFIACALSAALTASAAVTAPRTAEAQGISLVRDAEIERTIRAYATPLFEAAGLDPEGIKLYIVNDSKLNAFVSGGQNMYLTTGLLMRSEHAGQLLGVIAHETGHIAGGHLARLQEEMRHAQVQTLLSMVLGAAAAVAGQPAAGQAIIAGGPHVAGRQLLQYTRTHEASADQAATSYLERTGQSARGMVEFLGILQGQELLSVGRQDPYVRTHPISTERIAYLRNHIQESPYSAAPLSHEFSEMHTRMRAKLIGFLMPPAEALARYPEQDQSVAARYARAIAYYRKPDLARALPLVDALIAEHPQAPYFYELKGQMLFENGRLKEALAPYETAVRLLPENNLLRVSLAQVQLETNDPALNEAALNHLHAAMRQERRYVPAWSLLAVAYGRTGRIGHSALALAEKALILGDETETRYQLARADKLLPEGAAARIRIQDIKRALEGRR